MFKDNNGLQNTTKKTKDKSNDSWHKTLKQEVSLQQNDTIRRLTT